MLSLFRDLYYILLLNLVSTFSSQKLNRTLEPEQVTTDRNAVSEYDQALKSSLGLLYALNLKILSQLLPKPKDKSNGDLSLLDLACGPAVFGELACKVLSLRRYTGVDLSIPMLEKAKERFQKLASRVNAVFLNSDIQSLTAVADQSQDLITILDCTHHLNSTRDVEKVFIEAEKKIKPQGILLISDLVRPKNHFIANHYYHWLSQKNESQNMMAHNLDFKNSIFAAFTIDELATAIPKETGRSWYLLTPFGFQYTQIILSLEKGRKLELYDAFNIAAPYLPTHLKPMWFMTSITFRLFCRIQQIR